eukprot:scaffold16569_cov60-Phaeocystis_antarctica.AAC.10
MALLTYLLRLHLLRSDVLRPVCGAVLLYLLRLHLLRSDVLRLVCGAAAGAGELLRLLLLAGVVVQVLAAAAAVAVVVVVVVASFYADFFCQVSWQRLVALAAYSSLLIVANACLLVSFSSTAVSVQRIACLLRPLLYRLYTDYIPTLLPAACRARRRWRPACAARPARRAVAVAVAEAKGVLNSKAAARDRGFIKSRVRQACVRTRSSSWVLAE